MSVERDYAASLDLLRKEIEKRRKNGKKLPSGTRRQIAEVYQLLQEEMREAA